MKDNLNDDGFPYDGARLNSGDIIIGKHAEEGADHSIKLKHDEKGYVQKVVLSANDDGKNFTTVRIPSLGDNFSSMHGQKGILGFLESQENFPFTTQGIVTDIVINPHAFPSRQTPGELLEAALGKGIALGGSVEYVTSFSTPTIETRTDQLHMCGFSRWGNERVYDRLTGEKVESLMFMGLTFYQKLVHISEDKVRYRNKGPVYPLTRQPVADRKRFGGVKFGDLERDCICDASHMHICRKSKNMASVIQRSVPRAKLLDFPPPHFLQSPPPPHFLQSFHSGIALPCCKVNDRANPPRDEEVGDGTTSVVVLHVAEVSFSSLSRMKRRGLAATV
ncbi:DNA-directed RNA polymerases IV and V subunit 2-like protein [Tanacetum coccineum]